VTRSLCASLTSRYLPLPPEQPPQIFDAFCSRKALSSDSVRFLFDGQRINPNMTPKDVSFPSRVGLGGSREKKPCVKVSERGGAQFTFQSGHSVPPTGGA